MADTFLLILPLAALLCSLVCHALALIVFPRLGLLDFPERYGLSRPRIPYPVGIVAVVLFLVFYGSLAPASLKTACTVLAVAVLGLSSFTDDRRPLPPLLRAGVQVLIACILFTGGARILSFTNPLAGFAGGDVLRLDAWTLPFPGAIAPLSLLFTILWIAVTINALNWFDGLPGQVSTLSVIGFLTIGFLSLSSRVQQPFLALVAFVLAAIFAGSLFFELKPGRMLIGDTGAMFAGLMLGLLTIYSGGKVATAFLVLGVPLLDFFLVALRRLLSGRSIFRGSTRGEHLHHRLLGKGWPRGGIIILTAAIGVTFGLSALFMNTMQKMFAALLLFLLMTLLWMYSRPSKIPSS
jgi:UDP-GlcNAc:undecaprenyl-phosphate GlcNAc-1-phosphate transferase